MIVPMKKLTLLMSERDKESALTALRKLGVLHVKNINVPASEDIQALEERLTKIERVRQILSAFDIPEGTAPAEKVDEYIDEILALDQEKENKKRELAELDELHGWFEKWGAVSLASIKKLQDAGIYVRFYSTDKNGLKTVPADKIVHIVRNAGNLVQLALFSRSPEDKLELKEESMPEVEYAELVDRMEEIRNKIVDIDQEIHKRARIHHNLPGMEAELQRRLALARVKAGMGADHQIAFLQGFCPQDNIADVINAAERNGWGYISEEPDDPSEVPTLTRNPKPIGIIKPLFDFMGTLPGYNEMDISHAFLVFFSLFFAMLIGDAGYGLVFLLGTMWIAFKKKDAPREPFFLMYVLSGATIAWGVITGTWFGAEKIARIPFFQQFIIDQIDSYVESNQTFMMYLTFIVGVVHLTVAHLLAGLKKIKSPTAVAELGWILIMWGLFYVAGNLVLGKTMPVYTKWLFISGAVLVAFFANFQKNILKGFGLTIGNLPLSIISSFSDVVSYLRLFAVGYATVTVATAFNTMAVGNGISNIFTGFGAALILVLGHGLNIILGMMSVLVHGVRLNMLEFSGHVGMQWSGKPYEPFKE